MLFSKVHLTQPPGWEILLAKIGLKSFKYGKRVASRNLYIAKRNPRPHSSSPVLGLGLGVNGCQVHVIKFSLGTCTCIYWHWQCCLQCQVRTHPGHKKEKKHRKGVGCRRL